MRLHCKSCEQSPVSLPRALATEDHSMKFFCALAVACLFLVSCQQTANDTTTPAPAKQGRLSKSPIGSTFKNHYVNEQGLDVNETYQVQADHSVKLVDREAVPGNS
jgi:hypothetical protein